MAQQYTRRPPTCEAMILTPDNLAEVAAWCDGAVVGDRVLFPAGDGTHLSAEPGKAVMRMEGDVFVAMPAELFEAQWAPIEGA